MLKNITTTRSAVGSDSLHDLNQYGVIQVQFIRGGFEEQPPTHPELISRLGLLSSEQLAGPRARVSKPIVTISDNDGEVEYPEFISGSGLVHPGHSEATQIPMERRVMWYDVIHGLKNGVHPGAYRSEHPQSSIQPLLGCCEQCVTYGSWGFKYTGDENEPKIICCRPCHHCARDNGWIWGRYRKKEYGSGEFTEFKPIPNNGAICYFRHIEGIVDHYWCSHSAREHTNMDLIHRTTYELWNHHTDYDPPRWSEFFEKTPPWIHEIICDFYGVTESLDQFKRSCIPHINEPLLNFGNRGFGGMWDPDFEEYEEDEDDEDEGDEETNELTIQRKNKIGSVLSVLDEIMETKDQKLDQGKWLELCKLLKELHQE